MDTSDECNTSRRDSVSHTQPVVFDSPSCRRTAEAKAETPSQASIASASQTLRQADTTSKSYAYEQERKHVSSLSRRSRERSHRPRQRSSGHNSQSIDIDAFARCPSALTDAEIESQLLQLLEQETGLEEGDMVTPYIKAATVPPITHDSLSELDIGRIINNPKLRHDVNFDKELHFRPNLDGSRGRQKIRAADDYWKGLISELTIYRTVGLKMMACKTSQELEYWTRLMQASQKRMPIMFETIRDILKTLVPERDQPVVAERMDVAMIMQEISKGVFDMMSLAQWLATLLKAHCAPMRDEWIDQMVAQVHKGIELDDSKRIVIGLRQLLGILEAMKLDVANHQIRHLRAMLIDDGVNFQTKYHLTRLHYGRLDVARARRWYYREHCQHRTASFRHPDKLHVFISALFKSLLSQSSLSSLPETFSLDSDRLRAFRSDLHSFIYTQICTDVFDSLLAPSTSEETRVRARTMLKSSLASIVGDSRRHLECASNIAVEIVRLALAAEGSKSSFDAARIEVAEHRLRIDLQPSSIAFSSRNKQLREATLPDLERLVREHLPMTPLILHDRMFTPTFAPGALPTTLDRASSPNQQSKSIEAVLRRICHVAVLHWHIWSTIVYDIPTEEAGPLSPASAGYDSDGSSASGSDTESEAGSDVSELSSATTSPLAEMTPTSEQPPTQ